ncbi:MAG: hypothetical protein JWN73_1440 [Betaproteobacteria bacterium]|nr:hypothetical protein [Betaproteobacteria bacterium]
MPEKSNNKKVLLIIFGGLFAVAIAVVGGGYWFFKHQATDFFRETQAAAAEARKAGANMSEVLCFDRAAERLKTPEGHSIGGSIRNSVVLGACLQPSQPVASFCEGVPDYGNILDGALWEAKTCAALDETGAEYCTHMVREVAKYCSSPGRAAKLLRAANKQPGNAGTGETK